MEDAAGVTRLGVFFELPDGERFEPPATEGFQAIVTDTGVGSWSYRGPFFDWFDALADRPGRMRVRVIADGEQVLTGPVSVPDDDDDVTEVLTLSGPDDMELIRDAQTHPEPQSPVPTGTPPVYGLQGHDIRTGEATTIAAQFVDVNAGPSATPGRQRVALGLDPQTGGQVSIEARWVNLLTTVQTILVPRGVTATCLDRTFIQTPHIDRSSELVLAKAVGSVSKIRDRRRAAGATFVYGLGGGELTARVVQQAQSQDAVEWQRRIERIKDRRDVTDVPRLSESVAEELSLRGEERIVTCQLRSETGWVYGVDYTLGTIVKTRTRLGTFVAPIRQVQFDIRRDRSSAVVRLTVASAAAVLNRGQLDTQRLNSLEGSL